MTLQVKVSANFGRWIEGFGNLGPDVVRRSAVPIRSATKAFFDRSQENAHVLSGENKASGSMTVHVDGMDVVGTVEYDSDHAIYEEARGGSHAFLGRAWEATEEQFRRAMPDAWERTVESWR